MNQSNGFFRVFAGVLSPVKPTTMILELLAVSLLALGLSGCAGDADESEGVDSSQEAAASDALIKKLAQKWHAMDEDSAVTFASPKFIELHLKNSGGVQRYTFDRYNCSLTEPGDCKRESTNDAGAGSTTNRLWFAGNNGTTLRLGKFDGDSINIDHYGMKLHYRFFDYMSVDGRDEDRLRVITQHNWAANPGFAGSCLDVPLNKMPKACYNIVQVLHRTH